MFKIEEIKRRYEQLPGYELTKIAENHENLRAEIIPILIEALKSKGEEEALTTLLKNKWAVQTLKEHSPNISIHMKI